MADPKDNVDNVQKRIRDFAHEVRTPLTAISGYTKMLSEAKKRELSLDTIEDYAATAFEASTRLVRICERILEEEIASEKIFRKEKIDFNQMAGNLIKEFAHIAKERNVDLNVSIVSNFPILFTDPLILNQTISNLISNSIKYTKRGGTVELRGEVDFKNRAIILVVKDDGEGIPKDLLAKLLQGQRISTADNDGPEQEKGWGRGIQLVRDFAERLDAKLNIASNSGTFEGTVVSLRFENDVVWAPK